MNNGRVGVNDGKRNFSMRLNKEVWEFLKKHSVDIDESMASIIDRCLTKYKNRIDKKNSN